MDEFVYKCLTTGPFHGIDTTNAIVIQFPPAKKNSKKRPITLISGEAGKGKSSIVNSLLYGLAYDLGFKIENLINTKTKKMEGEQIFTKNGQTWRVKYTATKFQLFRLYDEKSTIWVPQDKPVERLKALVGTVAVSPLKLRTDNGKNQVDWLFKMLNMPANIIQQTQLLATQYEAMKKARARANEEYAFLQKQLSENPMYQNWHECEIKYKEERNAETLESELKVATSNKLLYEENKEKVGKIDKQISEKHTELRELEEKLKNARKEIAVLEDNKKKGEEWLDKNKKVLVAHTKVVERYKTLHEYLAEQRRWREIVEQKRQMDEYESLVQTGDIKKAEYLNTKRELLASVVPALEGLEIITEDEIDGKKTGVYLHGKNPNQLSESELFDMYFQLCRAIGVTVAVVEDPSRFGTDAINTLNEMARHGIYIWATEMRRGKDLKIEFVSEL